MEEMRRRMQSIRIMQALQPFTQLGIITPFQAGESVRMYVSGDDSGIRSVCSLELPQYMDSAARQLLELLNVKMEEM